jgi:hypothetical protein
MGILSDCMKNDLIKPAKEPENIILKGLDLF